MLQAINDKAKGVIGGIIILFISVPFALWGIQEYIGGAEQPFAAKVNDVEISLSEYEQALSRQRQRLQSVFGNKLPEDPAFEARIKQQVVDQLVNQKLLEQMALSVGYSISDQALAQKIQSIEAFQQDGQFISSTYKDILRSQGMTASEFEQLFRRDLMVQQLQNGITNTSFVAKASLERINQLQEQMRTVRYLLYKHASYTPDIEVSDAEIEQYYDENRDRYMHPEKVSVAYVELKGDDLDVQASIDEEALRRQYDNYVAGLAGDEERKARHILIQVKADDDEKTKAEKKQKMQDILQRIRTGESFADLAEQFSEDPSSAGKGGDLGWVSKGMMVPAFDEALYAMDENEVSDVITTSFGYHIIRVDDIKAPTPISFEDKKSELMKAARQEEIDNIFYERSETMATLAYENDQTLQPIVESMASATIEHSNPFTRNGGPGIAQYEVVRNAAFSDLVLKEGRNSDVIEVGKNHIVVLRLDQHQPAKPRSLEEVRPQVELALKSEKAHQKAQADALQALASLEQGANMSELAQQEHAVFNDLGEIRRDHADVDRRIVNNAFKMKKPEQGETEYDSIELTNGVAVIALYDVREASSGPGAEKLQATLAEVQPIVSNQEMTAMLEYIRSRSEIVIAKDLF